MGEPMTAAGKALFGSLQKLLPYMPLTWEGIADHLVLVEAEAAGTSSRAPAGRPALAGSARLRLGAGRKADMRMRRRTARAWPHRAEERKRVRGGARVRVRVRVRSRVRAQA